MLASTRILLEAILDYAGTFPPAGLPLPDAMANYARDRSSGEGWMLGRFVLPASGVRDFERLAPPRQAPGSEPPWSLTIVFGGQPAGLLDEVLEFAQRAAPVAQIVSVEFPPLCPTDIQNLFRRVPTTIEAFFEVPIDADLERGVNAVAAIGALAKVRTGGVIAGGFPSPEGLVRFLTCCSEAGIAFKATAGLHHAVRGCYPLTYEPGSHTDTMHGFLNLCVAAALVKVGADPSEAADALVDSRAEAFHFRADGLGWRDRLIAIDNLADTRRHFFRSFGSCAFREPVDELARLGLL